MALLSLSVCSDAQSERETEKRRGRRKEGDNKDSLSAKEKRGEEEES